MNMWRIWLRIISIPKTLFVNFRYFPFSIALKFPFFVRYNATIRIKGRIVITGPVKKGMIHFGFNEHPCCNRYDKTMLYVEKGGVLSINGRLYMGNGCKICVHTGSTLEMGDYVRSTGSTAIDCFKSIKIGNNVLFSWDCLVMDSDSHKIFPQKGI